MKEIFSERYEYIVGLDAGSGTAKCMVGELGDQCNLKVIGAEEIPMTGDWDTEEGLNENSRQIHKLIKSVEEQTKLEIYTLYITAGRGEIKGLNVTGSMDLDGARITKRHCSKLLKSASRLSIPHGFELIHILPQKYYIDENKKVTDPTGFSARKLEVDLHVISGDSKSLNRKRALVKNAGYYIEGIVVDSLASFLGGRGLYSRERDVLILNVGAKNTDILFFVEGQIVITSQIFFGLNDIINEFEYRFGITEKDAGKLLRSYIQYRNSCSVHSGEKNSSSFTIVQKLRSGPAGYSPRTKKISEHTISLVVSYMITQMIAKVKGSIIGYLKNDISTIQVVLMGGGAYLGEMEKEFREKFGCDIIIGENKLKSGGDLFGTAYGLLRYGAQERRSMQKEEKAGIAARIKQIFLNLSSWAKVPLS